MAKERNLTHSYLLQVLDYNPETGDFRWRVRNIRPQWNTRYAGKIAGCLDGRGYLRISIDKCRYWNHRLAFFYMTGRWPEPECDHRDLNKLNNKWENLREANQFQNMANIPATKRNTSGYKGVSIHKRDRLWRARVNHNGKLAHCSYHKTPEAAADAYADAARRLHGEFARF